MPGFRPPEVIHTEQGPEVCEYREGLVPSFRCRAYLGFGAKG